MEPPPVPIPAIPPVPDPPPVAVYIPELPLAELPAAQPMGYINKPAGVINRDSDPEGYNLEELFQPESSGQNNDPISPARVRLSVPLGLPLAAAPIPVAPIMEPPPVPVPAIPPVPDPPPVAVYIPELPLAELPAAQPMGYINKPAGVINRDSDPEGYNLEELFQPESSGQNNDPISPARVRLSVPLGLPLAAAPIPVAPIMEPPPVPVPAIPPAPDPPPVAVYIPELPLAELPAAQPMGYINKPAGVINRDSDPEGYNLEELFQPESSGQNNDPISPARVRLSVPLGLPLAAAPIPPVPDTPPEAVYIPELALAELPAAQPMGCIKKPAGVINRDSDPEGYNLEDFFQEPQPVVRRKTAAEARNRIHAQIRFSNDVRYHSIPKLHKQPRRQALGTVDGHEVAPITFSPRSTQNENRTKIQKKVEEVNESFPPPEKKTIIFKDSVKRSEKQPTKRKDGPGSNKDSVNSIYDEPNIFVGPGNVLQFPGSIAHYVSSDFKMTKGVARQISSAYPCIRQTLQSLETPIVESSVAVSLPWENKSNFQFSYKISFFEKITYYNLSRSLNCMDKHLLQKGIQ